MLTFTHIFKSCSQDSCAVLAVMTNVIQQLKITMPGLKTVCYWQDNAGCYHCGTTLTCAEDIHFWMLNNGLKLNDDKTEFLTIGTSQQLEKLDNISIHVGDSDIHPMPIARNLVSWFDSRLSMAAHITKICASSFYYIYNIRRIRKYLSQQSTETLIHAFITSRLDYCNGLLYGLPDCLLNKL